jgi:hypothetical protein
MASSIISNRLPGISNGFCKRLQHPPFTPYMCSSLMLIRPFLPRFGTHPGFIPSSMVFWVLLIALTSAAPHPLKTQTVTRVCRHKAALLHVPLIFASRISCPTGRGTLHFSTRPAELIFTSQRGGITLQMLVLPRQMCCLSLIEMWSTIRLPRERKSFVLFKKSSL